jgi:hypothetical protein
MDQKNIKIFTAEKKLKMLQIRQHIEMTNRFSPEWDYAGRGACFATE